jgi:transposase
MSRHFRPWTIDQTQLLPAAVVDYVPAGHLAQFVVALAREHLDLSEIVASYKSGLGQPPFDPRMMTALLLYAVALVSIPRGGSRRHAPSGSIS